MAKHYDKEFKQNAPQYRKDNPQLSVATVCRILGITPATYYNWKRSAEENDNEVVLETTLQKQRKKMHD